MADEAALALFAHELQAARARTGLSRDALAKDINYSPALVGMVETCRRVPTLDFARRCDDVLATPGTFERMQVFLRTAPFPAWFRPFVEYETRASALRGFEHGLVPGLLQTEAYARAVTLSHLNTSEEKADALVAARMDRQQAVLGRNDPPLLWAVLDEAVLHRPVGGTTVMRAQLERLADASESPNIVVQVIPAEMGAHPGLLGAFVIADMGSPDSGGVAYLETVAGGQVIEDRSAVAQVALTFDALRCEALPRSASRELITKVAEEWT